MKIQILIVNETLVTWQKYEGSLRRWAPRHLDMEMSMKLRVCVAVHAGGLGCDGNAAPSAVHAREQGMPATSINWHR